MILDVRCIWHQFLICAYSFRIFSDVASTNVKDVLSSTITIQTSQKSSTISTANGKYVKNI